jgi:hypothetical protein
MKISLAEIEEQLQSFVEGSLPIFSWGHRKDQIAPLLMGALRSSLKQNDQGELLAPSLLTIFVHPRALSDWQNNQIGLDALARILQGACQEAGIRFLQPPVVRLATSYDLAENDVRINTSFPTEEILSQTAAIVAPLAEAAIDSSYPCDAFLIINGTEIFPLRLNVINLGRRVDNQIVIHDPKVSRHHAQLRAVRNHYVLFDLNSSGGTYVNGQRISQITLKPGDVISLSGVSLVYGEDNPPPGQSSRTPTADIKPLP